MAIIKQYHKDTDTTYVYESISYWDAEKGQSRSRRKCIGKIDPETGEMVPTGKRGRAKKEPDSPSEEPSALCRKLEAEIDTLKEDKLRLSAEVAELTRRNRRLEEVIRNASAILSDSH